MCTRKHFRKKGSPTLFMTWRDASHGGVQPCTLQSASERKGNNLKGFKDFYFGAKTRIWP